MIDLQPVLEGEILLVRPLRAANLDALHAAASDPLIWEQHPSPLRYQRVVFGVESASAYPVTMIGIRRSEKSPLASLFWRAAIGETAASGS